jgi:hypothetical protein
LPRTIKTGFPLLRISRSAVVPGERSLIGLEAVETDHDQIAPESVNERGSPPSASDAVRPQIIEKSGGHHTEL